jgi:hypothetical protein
MTKLKFKDLPQILEWIREPSHSEHLYMIKAAIQNVENSKFIPGSKVVFGRPNGQQRVGVVLRTRNNKATVEVSNNHNDRKSQWRVPFDLMRINTNA